MAKPAANGRGEPGKRGRKPAKVKRLGRRHAARVGDRLTRSQIAERARIDRGTVSKYLAMEGAPRPDKQIRYSYRAAMDWIDRQAPRIASNSEEMRKIKESKLRMEAEDMAIDLAVKRGQYVDKATIEPAIATFMAQLTDDLRTKFEQELPPKYEGRKTIERQQLNAAAIDWVLLRIKTGTEPLTK